MVGKYSPLIPQLLRLLVKVAVFSFSGAEATLRRIEPARGLPCPISLACFPLGYRSLLCGIARKG